MMCRWDQKDIPHKGWTCQNVEDICDGSEFDSCELESCEMCGTSIRYIHIMEHNSHPNILRVGCICAEKMSDDYIQPRKREKNLKNKALRRNKWLNRRWRTSQKGNQYLNLKGNNIGVRKKRNGKWGWWINSTFSRRSYDSENKAKMELFDYFTTYIESQK